MPIDGLFFENQYLTAKGLGAFGDVSLSDGILTGCGMSLGTNTITISEGYAIVGGRVFHVPSTNLGFTPGSGYASIVATVNTNLASEIDTFSQVSFRVIQGNSIASVLGGLSDTDINLTGRITEAILAIAIISLGDVLYNKSIGQSMVKLWEHTPPDGSGGLSPQEVVCPEICFYDTFYIVMRRETNNYDVRIGTMISVPNDTPVLARPMVLGSWNNRLDATFRNITFNRSTGVIIFGEGTSAGGNYNTTTDASYAVPLAIYGLKSR